MATYTVSNAAPANFDFSAMFQVGATRTSTTPTTIVYTNPSGTKVVVSGAGFAFNGSGVATAGTISSIIVFDTTQVIPYVSITGLTTSLVDFHTAWLGLGGDSFGECQDSCRPAFVTSVALSPSGFWHVRQA